MKQIFLGILTVVFAFALAITVTSCTEQEMAKEFGGKAEVKLPKGQKLVTVTWKEVNLWYLTRPMRATDTAETYVFREESNFGIWEGQVTITETK